MEISLNPELERFLNSKVRDGQYKSIDEAINTLLKLSIERELSYQGRFEELRQEILIGIEASNRGEVLDSETVFNSLEKKLQQRREQNYE
ncbi:MAG: type II toxin-antitoxin system ParD family antitoxin [Prochloraceae cyanobacterium]